MNAMQERARQNLLEIVDYFKRVAQDCGMLHRRKIEYDIALSIANLISAKNSFNENDFLSLARCVNQIVGQEHANGSGWFDFQMKISGFYSAFGYKSDWSSATGRFTFWKEKFNLWNWLEKTRDILK